MGQTFTDSAGVTCTYTPVEALQPGDVVILGWRSVVHHVEIDGDRARVYWQGQDGGVPDQWNPLGTELPVCIGEKDERAS